MKGQEVKKVSRLKEEKEMAEAKYMGINVPYCPNCGHRIDQAGAEGPPLPSVGSVLRFYRNRVDRVHTETFPEDRQIGVKEITVVKKYKVPLKGKPRKGGNIKKKRWSKPIMETVQKTTAKCGLCGHELGPKTLLKKFGAIMNDDGQLIISTEAEEGVKALFPDAEPATAEAEKPKPEGK